MLSAVTSNPDLQSIKGKNLRNVLNGCGAKPATFNESDQEAQTSPLPWAQAEGRDEVWAGVLPSWSPPHQHGSSAPFSVRMWEMCWNPDYSFAFIFSLPKFFRACRSSNCWELCRNADLEAESCCKIWVPCLQERNLCAGTRDLHYVWCCLGISSESIASSSAWFWSLSDLVIV